MKVPKDMFAKYWERIAGKQIQWAKSAEPRYVRADVHVDEWDVWARIF